MVKREDKRMDGAAIESRDAVYSTPFFRLMAKRLAGQSRGHPYYSLDLLDYVTVVATTEENELLLVRQFRPAVESLTLELPAGHVELNQNPEAAAGVELLEETGYVAEQLRLVGCLRPDTGRLSNRMWVYCAEAIRRAEDWKPEAGVEVVVASRDEVRGWLDDGTLDHALHVAAIFLAVKAGCLTV